MSTSTEALELDTIVIGASAGGFDALMKLAAELPPSFPAALLVVLHVGAHPSMLPERLASVGCLPAHHAQDGEPLSPGRIYVAPPDRHLLLDADSRVAVVKGPKENFARPAIDPLFRSAALARGSRVIGVILTGLLDDGTTGLRAVQAQGGVTIVENPETAHAADMPRNAMRHVAPDHVLPVEEIGPLLVSLAGTPAGAESTAGRANLADEHSFVAGGGDVDVLSRIARRSVLTCPDCGAALWHMHDSGPRRYRCHTGHAFSMESLRTARRMIRAADKGAFERALTDGMHALHEKKALSEELAGYHKEFGDAQSAARYRLDAQRADLSARELERFIRDPD